MSGCDNSAMIYILQRTVFNNLELCSSMHAATHAADYNACLTTNDHNAARTPGRTLCLYKVTLAFDPQSACSFAGSLALHCSHELLRASIEASATLLQYSSSCCQKLPRVNSPNLAGIGVTYTSDQTLTPTEPFSIASLLSSVPLEVIALSECLHVVLLIVPSSWQPSSTETHAVVEG